MEASSSVNELGLVHWINKRMTQLVNIEGMNGFYGGDMVLRSCLGSRAEGMLDPHTMDRF